MAIPATSSRSIRHAWLTDVITEGSHGFVPDLVPRGFHAELTLGHGIIVGHNTVSILNRLAGIRGLSPIRRPR